MKNEKNSQKIHNQFTIQKKNPMRNFIIFRALGWDTASMNANGTIYHRKTQKT